MFIEQYTKGCIQYGKNIIMMSIYHEMRHATREGRQPAWTPEDLITEEARHKKLVEISWNLRKRLRLHRRFLRLLLDEKFDELL